jgi:signal transduction histidine kinase
MGTLFQIQPDRKISRPIGKSLVGEKMVAALRSGGDLGHIADGESGHDADGDLGHIAGGDPGSCPDGDPSHAGLIAARDDARRLREQLRDEVASREEFLDVVSHELSTPITVISGYSRLLLSEEAGPLTDRQRQFLEESQRSCRRLSEFVRGLATSSSLGVECAALQLGECSLDELIRGVLSFLAPVLTTAGRKVTLDLGHDGVPVRVDGARIEQVLSNLLCNAIKYAKSEDELLIATRPAQRAGRPFIEVSLLDRGAGIAPQDRDRIFESYVRLDRDRQGEGLGLGLAICRRIVEDHGGVISVDERPGGGSRFAFLLPAAPGGSLEDERS